jgi:hypothetical protein
LSFDANVVVEVTLERFGVTALDALDEEHLVVLPREVVSGWCPGRS